jgi:hypothetical protein
MTAFLSLRTGYKGFPIRPRGKRPVAPVGGSAPGQVSGSHEEELSMAEPTRPSRETRETERREAERSSVADRAPTPDEEAAAESHELDEEVIAHERDMAERGAKQRGEGRVP